MTTVKTRNKLEQLLKERQKSSKIVGLVPTMGALHQGHFSLIEKAQQETDLVVVSIFVNPTQFDNASDLQKYPRELKQDIDKLSNHFKDIIVFAPLPEEIYEEQIAAEHFDFDGIENQMEGKYRDGHFDGVGTILKKLFTIINPDKAFFGEKDYQQLMIVKKLVEIIDMPIQVIGCPINREESGLARSSRNKRLSAEDREKATLLFKSLTNIKADFGTIYALKTYKKAKEDFNTNSDFKLDYLIIADAKTLVPCLDFDDDRKYRAFIAAEIGGVRLIDNMALN